MNGVKRAASLLWAAVLMITLFCPAAFADEAKLTLNRTTASLAVGDSVVLEVSGAAGDITWSSLTTAVAQVDASGRVTGLSEGKAVITAKDTAGGGTVNCTVTVYMAMPAVSLHVGQQKTLQTNIAGGTWRSADPTKATVDENGVVTGAAFGRTYITVSGSGGSESFSVTVGGHAGIDISYWNNTIDWQAIKAQGIEFAMIRAGYGLEHTDRNFVTNINGAIASGIPFGIYFYSYAQTAEQAQTEANYCKKLLEPYRDKIALPVAYDLEQYDSLSGTQLVDFAKIFCSTLQDAGFHTMVYANSNYFSKMDLTPLRNMGVDFWYAWYPNVPNLSTIHTIRGTKDQKPMMWQYSDSCVVRGALASGRTDINVLYSPEHLSFTAPTVTASAGASGAVVTWGGSTWAKSYTVYRHEASGETVRVGVYDGKVHKCTDSAYTAGAGYSVAMEIWDPIDHTVYKTYTSEPVRPSAVTYTITAKAGEGGTVTGGGSYAAGTSVTLTAAAQEGYTFEGWYDGAGNRVGSESTYRFTVDSAAAFTAQFKKDAPTPPPVVTPDPTDPPDEPQQPEQPGNSDTQVTFTDVPETAWYAPAVGYAVEKGLFTGTGKNQFTPGGIMDRSMLVTVLYRRAGSPEASNRNRFTDVSKDAWYAKAVTWASDNAIMTGTGEKTFSPTAPVTREQIATILQRYSTAEDIEIPVTAEGDLSRFSDSEALSAFAKEGMAWAVSTQLMNGDNGKLMPKKSATRAECATILMRWLEAGNEIG